MPSLNKNLLNKLHEILASDKPLLIGVLASGQGDNLYKLPVIFLGPKYHRFLLFPEHITEELLLYIFDKALKDNNHQAIIDLLRYIVYNGITFWEHHKNTELGTKVMATVLGQHD